MEKLIYPYAAPTSVTSVFQVTTVGINKSQLSSKTFTSFGMESHSNNRRQLSILPHAQNYTLHQDHRYFSREGE